MANPISKTEDLIASLQQVLKKQDLGAIPRNYITNVCGQLEKLHTKLVGFQENVSLDYEEQELLKNLAFWNELTAGRINPEKISQDKHKGESLIDNSKTLNAFLEKGIDIPVVYKFSEEEIRTSDVIADCFFGNNELYRSFRKLVQDNVSELITTAGRAIAPYELIKALYQSKAIGSFEIQKYALKEGRWEKTDSKDIKRLSAKYPHFRVRILYNNMSTASRQLISGHWFNANTYQILSEHLKRRKFDHEIYTRVQYESPKDIFVDKGDFDILAMVGSKILLVECKSGILTDVHNEIGTLINKTTGLRRVFGEDAGYQYTFLCVYNHNIDIEESVKLKLQKAEITLVAINEVRSSLEKLLK